MGICLGFEVLTFLEANGVEHRTNCSSMKQPLPLEFQKGINVFIKYQREFLIRNKKTRWDKKIDYYFFA